MGPPVIHSLDVNYSFKAALTAAENILQGMLSHICQKRQCHYLPWVLRKQCELIACLLSRKMDHSEAVQGDLPAAFMNFCLTAVFNA